MHLPAQSREFCSRNWVPIPAFHGIHHRQHNHVKRIFNRRLAEQEAACYSENCRVQSNSQSQRENYGGSKSWILAQHTQAIAKVVDEACDDVHPTRIPALFFCAFDSAELEACAPYRFLERHSAADQIFRVCLDVEAQFRIHLSFHARSPQNGLYPGSKTAPESHTSCDLIQKIPNMIVAITPISSLPSGRPSSRGGQGSKVQIARPG